MKLTKTLVSALALWAFLLPAGASAAPAITAVLNNYSYTPPGYPNSGVTPSTLFIIQGTGLANATSGPVTLQSSAAPGLPTTLNGATVSVTVGGVTVTPGMYYALPTQIAAVLPGATPAGTASVTVSLAGTPSAAFQFQVVPAAVGLDTYYGTGTGLVTATDSQTGALINTTNSATPGETIVLWGSGLGADTADPDTLFTSSPHAVNQSSTQVYFGSMEGTVVYAGSSGYPGLNQINVTIPANVGVGCRVSIVAVVSGVDSNFATIPINPSGGVCSDPVYSYNGTDLAAAVQTSSSTSGIVAVEQLATTGIADVTVTLNSGGIGDTAPGPDSLGGCTVALVGGPTGVGGTFSYLSVGTVSVQGPEGTYSLTNPNGPYSVSLPAGAIPASGGTYTFTASGSAQVGPFTATVNLSPLMTWTNSSAAKTVTRSAGLVINWSGGSPGYIQINGQSSASTNVSASYSCYVAQSAGTFTVPPFVLNELPAGTGNTTVENFTTHIPFTVSGINSPYTEGGNIVNAVSTYQ